MELKDIRILKRLSQVEASEICNIPLRSYKRMEKEYEIYKDKEKYLVACQKLLNVNVSKLKCKNRKITVVGAGYVGLSIATMLSTRHIVQVIDIDENKINKINNRVAPFNDSDIDYYFNNKTLNLSANLPHKDLYLGQDYIIIALPTNLKPETHSFDMEIIKETIKEIREVNKRALIIIKSTCEVGFTTSIKDKNIIYVPEFLKEGSALRDNLYPSRIIVGDDYQNKKSKEFIDILLESSLSTPQVVMMSSKEAEACKLFSNAYLALRVAYFNELDSFALKNELDTKNIIEGMSLDPRIGDYYNNPSFGYGGYCLPKDVESLVNLVGEESLLISSIDKSNRLRAEQIATDVIKTAKEKGEREEIVIGVYSTEFKKGSDNNRNSSISTVIKCLKDKNVEVLIYDKNNLSLEDFIKRSTIIIANRLNPVLERTKDKIYTRDIFRMS